MHTSFGPFLIRDWQPTDRATAAELIRSVLAEYGLTCEPEQADQDVWHVEEAYWKTGGEFWVVEHDGQLVGTGGYYPIKRGDRAVEVRKMYLLPAVRRQGLGRFLLHTLETAIAQRGYQQIWVETATVLKEAVRLYETNGYQMGNGVETARCDRVYFKCLH